MQETLTGDHTVKVPAVTKVPPRPSYFVMIFLKDHTDVSIIKKLGGDFI